MVGIVETIEEFERYAKGIISPPITQLGGIARPATSAAHHQDWLAFTKPYHVGAATMVLSYDNCDYHTYLHLRPTLDEAATGVDLADWLRDRGEIERKIAVRCNDQYLPMALQTYADLLRLHGVRFLKAHGRPV